MSNINIYNDHQTFFGTPVVYRTHDELGNIIVTDYRQYRNLTFDSTHEQSSMDLKKPHILVHEYTQVMMLVFAFIEPCHATILGLGGGCLVRSLFHAFPACALHAVELRQRVHEIAIKFFGMPTSDHITVTIADAKQWLKNANDTSTEIIFSDMYQAYGMNPLQAQIKFITHCCRVLHSDGWLVINYHNMPKLDSPFFKRLCSLFSDVFACSTFTGNTILFASKHPCEELDHFEAAIPMLEEKLEISLMHSFKQLYRLKPS